MLRPGGVGGSGNGEEDLHGDLEARRQQLEAAAESSSMTGQELRDLVLDKWGRSYDVRLQRRGSKMYVHVMWKFLEQASFPLTEEEYLEALDAVATYVSAWGVADEVRQGIRASRRGPGMTGGRAANAIAIPLSVRVGESGRSGEWSL